MAQLKEKAQELFDSYPHKHPSGNVPNWDRQPERIKNIFRQKVSDNG